MVPHCTPYKPQGLHQRARTTHLPIVSSQAGAQAFEPICFERFLTGDRRPLCPYMQRTVIVPDFKSWVEANFASLD